MGAAPQDFWRMTCAEASLMIQGHQDRMMRRREHAVIAGCGPYDEDGIKALLSDEKPKPQRSKEEEAELVLKKVRRNGKVKNASDK